MPKQTGVFLNRIKIISSLLQSFRVRGDVVYMYRYNLK